MRGQIRVAVGRRRVPDERRKHRRDALQHTPQRCRRAIPSPTGSSSRVPSARHFPRDQAPGIHPHRVRISALPCGQSPARTDLSCIQCYPSYLAFMRRRAAAEITAGIGKPPRSVAPKSPGARLSAVISIRQRRPVPGGSTVPQEPRSTRCRTDVDVWQTSPPRPLDRPRTRSHDTSLAGRYAGAVSYCIRRRCLRSRVHR